MTFKHAFLAVLGLLAVPALTAQDSQLPPFVSRLTAVTVENGVLLSWQDSSEAGGEYLVYSANEEIDESNFVSARLVATVEAGAQEYVDTPETEGPHYYAVLASNDAGEPYIFFVPYRNKTTRGIRYTQREEPEKTVSPVSGIAALVVGDSVTVNFAATPGEDLIIYRSTGPIGSADDLVEAVLVDTQSYTGVPFVDKPMAGISYYYGVFYDQALRTGAAVFRPGENVLAASVQIPLAAIPEVAVEPKIRIRPLPYLMLTATVDSGEALKATPYETTPQKTTLSEETNAALARLLDGKKQPEHGTKKPAWLAPKDGGELENLLKGSFEENRWEDALNAIDSYMQTRRTVGEKQRAHFYKGQSLYYLKRYQEAFMEFVFAEEAYYTQVQPWLNDIISLLAAG
ncbi:MAG: hypothetical protein JW852_04780 [Spirochaetales bacterium]|nr:hypothetical protein [Spirochaetales bacterium]